jgi:hypothetical protein
LNQTTKLEVFVDALYSRKLEAVLCRSIRNKIFRCLRVAVRKLHVFSRREMIGKPGLTAFRLSPNRVSEDEALVRVPLFLYHLGVEITTPIAEQDRRV